jgi:ankyrin repeat protein
MQKDNSKKDVKQLKIPVPDAKNQNREEWTPMHYAAENGSLNVILSLVSRGAGTDPTD